MKNGQLSQASMAQVGSRKNSVPRMSTQSWPRRLSVM